MDEEGRWYLPEIPIDSVNFDNPVELEKFTGERNERLIRMMFRRVER